MKIIQSKIDLLVKFWQKPMVGVLASAMIVAQIGLLAALVRYSSHSLPQENGVTSASGSQGIQGAVQLSVVFKDTATAFQMRTLLDSLQAQIVGGPGAIGVWVIAIPKENLTKAAQAMSQAPFVESATPQ
jgi:hypothetical protein